MSVTYAVYSEFTQVYSLKNVDESEVSSYWLVHGALRVNEQLGCAFTIPFSSNNLTAKDLSIHYAALGILKRTRNQTDSQELGDYLRSRITDILSGGCGMITTSGEALAPDKDNGLNSAWSTNQNYNPTFDMRCPEDQRVDPNLIDHLYDRDDSNGLL